MNSYANIKLGLAMSLQENMNEETFEEEFDGSKAQLFNYLMWGDRHAEVLKKKEKLLQHEYVYDEKK